MTNDCKTCPVSTGTHQPAEALHHIAEPDAQHLQELAAYRFTVENLQARVAELEARLEIDHRHPYDGIAARDATIKAQDERIAELEADLEAVGAGGVEPLRKCNKLHQVAEPAAPVVKPIKDAIDALVMAAFTEGGCSEHRMSEARIQTELRKKELRTLLSTPQPCSRSHPHEEMTPMCELRTEVARLTNALARSEAQLAAAPQAVQPAVPDGWQMVPAKPTEAMVGAIMSEGEVDAVAGLAPELRPILLERAGIAARYTAMLAAAPAHPAEGGQDFATLHAQLLNFLGADDHMHATRLIAGHMAREHELTHPTQQGLDAASTDADRLIGRLLSSDPDFEDCTAAANLIRELTQNGPDGFATWKDAAVAERVLRAGMQHAIRALPRVTYGYKSDGDSRYLTSYESSEGQFLRHSDVMAALASQAKQGELANG